MQALESISIYNFRSCKRLENVELSDFTPLVGYNNAGKSNVLAAIEWLLRRSALPESSFFDPGRPVRVEGRISGISDEVLAALGQAHRPRLAPYVVDGVLRVRREQPVPGGSATAAKIHLLNPARGGADDPDAWDENPTGIENAMAALFPDPITIGAMEDAGKDVGKFETGSTIGKLIAQLMGAVRETQGQEIAARLEELRKILSADGDERAPELEAFDRRANEIVAEFFPGVEVKVHVPPPELATVFKAGTIQVYERQGDGERRATGRDVSSFGHGTQRAIQMSLIRQLAETADRPGAGRTLLLIDEPELYMHPQAVAKVRSALSKLSAGAYQVVFATHSPLMIGRDDLGAVLVLRKCGADGTLRRKRLAQAIAALEVEAHHQLGELFSVEGAAQVLFSERVILAEGKTERELVPDLFEAHHGAPPADHRVGFVPMAGSGSTAKCLRVLHEMEIPTRALVDLDFAFRQAVPSALLRADDPDIATCRDLCPAIAGQCGAELAGDGFFKKDKRRECFERLAGDAAGKVAIESLHEKLKEKNIWLWTKGAIESHLGITAKDPSEWNRLRSRLREGGMAAVADPEGVDACMSWLTGA